MLCLRRTAARSHRKRSLWDNTPTTAIGLAEERLVLILMGVAGSGKTTVGTLLAQKLAWRFADADDFHPPENKEKISRGVPLTDADRAPWLAAMRSAILQWNAAGENAPPASSAPTPSYPDALRPARAPFRFPRRPSRMAMAPVRSRHRPLAAERT